MMEVKTAAYVAYYNILWQKTRLHCMLSYPDSPFKDFISHLKNSSVIFRKKLQYIKMKMSKFSVGRTDGILFCLIGYNSPEMSFLSLFTVQKTLFEIMMQTDKFKFAK